MSVDREQLVERAMRRLRIGDAAGADRLTAEALSTAPHHRGARLVAARAQLRLGRPDEALRSLDAVDWYTEDTDDRFRIAARIVRAGALAQLDRTDHAIAELRSVLDRRPAHRGASLRLAALLLETDQPSEAAEVLERARHRRGTDRPSIRMLAEACERTGRYDRALALRRRLYRGGDRGRGAVVRIARLFVAADRIAEAFDAYDAVFERRKMNTETAHEAADLALRIGDTARAHRYLDAAIRFDPDDTRAAGRIAELYLSCGRFADAARCYWRLSRREDDDGRGLGGLIVTALCAGRYAMADRCLARYADRYDAATRRSQMTALWLAATPGRLLETEAQSAEPMQSRDVFALLVADAGRTLDRELSRHPDYADLHFHRAACRAALGDASGEAASLDAALSINPGYLRAGRRRIKSALRDGEAATARRVLDGLSERRDRAELADEEAKIAASESRAA